LLVGSRRETTRGVEGTTLLTSRLGCLALLPTVLAAGRCGELPLCKELRLPYRKDEGLLAVTALDGLVSFVAHVFPWKCEMVTF
jgi:hypothetical protein